jgi:dTDP-4-amino-4,6-dideoxygalactose transaminase
VEAFEREFASYLGVNYVVGVANGTDALLLALRAVGAEGKGVVVAANAGMYGTLAVLDLDCQPVFVDVDPKTALIDLDAAVNAIDKGGFSAVIVTHIYGRMQDIEGFVRYARSHGVVVIEDCAQAHGAHRGNAMAGTVGDVGCFSFYPTKNLGALGDGGALVTNDALIAEKLRQLRQYGWTQKYRVTCLGGKNSRLDELQAAVLRTRLPHLDNWNAARRAIAERYAAMIEHPKVFVPPVGGTEYVAHLMVVRVKDRDAFLNHLRAIGVPFDIHYPIPDHWQPAMASGYADVCLPETEAWAREVVTLPCFPGMTESEVDFIASAINRWR